MPAGKFEATVARAVTVAVAATEGDREVVRAARAERQTEKRARRQQRELELGAKIAAMPNNKYGVVLADPAWRFEAYSDETGMDRAAGNYYPTMDGELICRMDIPAADDCVLFLWATVPMLPSALMVMSAWGFEYKSHLIWKKNKEGTGYWNRNQHELLLVGTRGEVPAPAPGDQPASVIEAPVGRHSEKPAVFRKLIENMFPSLPRVELFARDKAAGWEYWGNEVEVDCPDCGGTGFVEVPVPAARALAAKPTEPPAPARARASNDVDTEASAAARRAYFESTPVIPDDLTIPEFMQRKPNGRGHT
jgi:N6-adenosine-specific RNA methylase IME4